MIVISMVLVVVAFVALMLGVLGVGDEPLQFVYASIVACLVAAFFLIAGVLRGRPSRKPIVTASGQEASWAGASSWGGPQGAEHERPLPRDAGDSDDRTAAEPAEVEVVGGSDGDADDGRLHGEEAFSPPPETFAPTADSELEALLADVPGVGPRERKALHARFGSVAGLRGASVDDIAETPGVDREAAARIAAQLGNSPG